MAKEIQLYWKEISDSIWTVTNPLCSITIVHGVEGFVVVMANNLSMRGTIEEAKACGQKMFADMMQQLIEE